MKKDVVPNNKKGDSIYKAKDDVGQTEHVSQQTRKYQNLQPYQFIVLIPFRN